MPRRAAHFTQADIARAIRAAKQEGADRIEVEADKIHIYLNSMSTATPKETIAERRKIAL